LKCRLLPKRQGCPLRYGNIPKNNNFDLIRLLLSLTVFLVHSYELSKNPGLSMIPVFLNTHTAVCAFFVISGFLVSSSFANSTTPAEYFSKRIRRVFPGYVVVVLLCGLAGVAFSEYSYGEYFSFPLLRYLGANLSFLNFIQPSLPGVFIGNSSPFVNGALWTIRLELLFYLSVPMVFMLLKRFRKSLVFLLMFGIALISRVIFDRVAQNQPDNHLVTLLSYYFPVLFLAFISGAFLFFYYREFEKHKIFFFLLSLAGYALSVIFVLPLIRSFFLSVIVIYLACSFKYLGNTGKYGDLSYGVYIWHFPVLQVFIAQGMFRDSPTLFLLFAVFTVISLAFLSWHCIEKPFLRRTSHYRIASEKKD